MGIRESVKRKWRAGGYTRRLFGLVCCVLLAGCAEMALGAGPDGLVGFWRFDEGSGAVARDSSGEKNHGTITGATFVKRGEGHALHFDGETSFVEVGPDAALEIGASGTISLWYKPDELQGALFSWGVADASEHKNFVVVFDTRTAWGDPGNELLLSMGGGRKYQKHSQRLPEPREGGWNHIALTINDRTVTCYRDGAPDMVISLPFTTDLSGVPLLIGKYPWRGKPVFKGLIDEVRVYDRPLSDEEMLADYQKDAPSFGADATLLKRPRLEVETLADPGRIVVRAQCALMGSLPDGSTVEVVLSKPDEGQALASQKQPVDPDGREMILNLDVAKLPAAKYRVRAIVRKVDGESFGEPSVAAVDWSGQTGVFRNVKVLNNLVWELINDEPGVVNGAKEYTFVQPKRRWVYVACTAGTPNRKLSVSIDDSVETRDIIVIEPGAESTQETMRFMPAGEHTLTLRAEGAIDVDRLIVRSIPELLFATLIAEPHMKPHGPYDSAFMKKYVVPNVNAFVLSQGTKPPRWEDPRFNELQGRGIHWYHRSSVPGRKLQDDPVAIQEIYDYLAGRPGLNRADLHGTMVDEFGVSRPHCAVYAQALRKLQAEGKLAGKVYYPYVGRLYTGADGREFVKALMDTNSAFALKRYLRICHTEQASYDFAYRHIIGDIRKYRDLCPGSLGHMTVCFGYLSAPNEFLNVAPQANYKVFLDMQFNIVANAPECWGVYGLMGYLAHYSDEETLRWIVHLFRHYGIEGATERASDDPFDDSRLMANGDFDPDTRPWELSPAAPNSIRQVSQIHFGWLQGRFQYTPAGDTALLMVRSAEKPNAFSQTIRNLEPGRMYAFRMITGEYQNLGRKEKHAVSIRVDGVEVIPERSFSYVFHNCYSHAYKQYDRDNPAWMNYHWVLFRAKSPTAKVTVSDWASEEDPGGRIGQELMFNFLQVHPYFEG